MEQNKNKYVEVAYKLYVVDDDGKDLVEEATADRPFSFITGFGIALDEFEKTVERLEKGATFDLMLTPAQAYGNYSEERVLHLDREIFTINGHFDHENIYKDALVPLQNEEGKRFMGRVVEVENDSVVMDLNHPLAGMVLNFKGSIVENREATNEEIEGVVNRLSGEGCACDCSCEGHHHHGDGHCHCHE